MLEKRVSPRTINCHLSSIRLFYDYLVDEENLVIENPVIAGLLLKESPAVPDIPLGPVIRGYEESAFVNFLEQSHDAAGGWPRYGGPPAAG